MPNISIKEKEEKLNELGYKLLKYVNANEIHIEDLDGYKYRTSFSTFTRGRKPCKFYKNNIYQKQNVLNLMKHYNMDCKLLTIDENEITFMCNKHIENGIQAKTIRSLQNNLSNVKLRNSSSFSLCYKCSRDKIAKHNKTPIKDIYRECKRLNVEYVKHIYENSRLVVYFICNKHIEKGIQHRQWGDMKNAKSGCVYCANWTVDKEDFIKRLTEVKMDKILDWIGTYHGMSKNTKFHCKKCNKNWYATPTNVLKGTGCPYCNESRGERYIRIFLESNNIYYIPQYKFKDCKDKRQLPFDFYIPYYNLCIEFQGEQHYKSIDFYHSGNPSDYKSQKKRDNIKRNYCKNNHIDLLEIRYDEIENIPTILTNKLIA